MQSVEISIEHELHCSQERAFKTPMLCDVLKVHSGYLFMPRALSVSNDSSWGQAGGSKLILFDKIMAAPVRLTLLDQVVDRIENRYWKIEVSNPKGRLLFFEKLIGEWKVHPLGIDRNLIIYRYFLVVKYASLKPLAWIFAHVFWKKYMQKVMKNIEFLAKTKEPYLYP